MPDVLIALSREDLIRRREASYSSFGIRTA
jgi:hypothetical protein